MGLLAEVTDFATAKLSGFSTYTIVLLGLATVVTLSIVLNVLNQLLPRHKSSEPPLVFHVLPWLGNTIEYGIDPYRFFFNCRKRYGDVFTFVLLGRKTTVCLGTTGNDRILNGKLSEVNAEDIYKPLTAPVFGKDVVYDCPNSKLMEQKKFVKFGLTTEALRSYVELIRMETIDFTKNSSHFRGQKGSLDLPPAMAELTIYTASRSLQGKEVREKFDSTFADLYHDLDMGFQPINFLLHSAPLPHNRKRDYAQKKMTETYMEIIKARRQQEKEGDTDREVDMIWNLMGCKYKDGTPVPDMEVAHMMIALLMAGQHSSSATISWIMLRLASRPDIAEDLLKEQKRVLGEDLPDFSYEDLSRLPLHAQVVKETLRIHAPIHSIMRAVKQPFPIDGTPYVVPTSHVLLAAPGVTSKSGEYFPEPALWEPHRWDLDFTDASAEKVKYYESLRPIIAASTAEEEEKTDYGYGLVSKGASSPYLPFGAGRHRCIGEQFAYVQLQTILATMVRIFKFRNANGKEDVVGTDYSSLFSRPLHPAVVEWEKRAEAAAEEKKV